MFPKPVLRTLPDHLKWECKTPKKGESIKGVIAGETHTVAVHWDGKSNKPCMQFISEGKLRCHCQDKPCSVRVIGYVPLIERDGSKTVVIVSATLLARVEAIKLGTPVEFSRGLKEKRPLGITLLRDFDIGEDFCRRIRPACCHNICEYLLHLWQIRDLNNFFGVDHFEALCMPVDVSGEKEAA